ncbi:MAG: tryptophan synthase subunit alpha [Rikenellaceae bacterium]
MNRIDKLFAEKDSNILSVYYPAGFPKLDDTMAILTELQTQGVDMVELGIPFSDPMADGVVIQEAATQALTNGISLKLLFEQIASMRSTIDIPVILMGYLNPIMQYGFEQFCADCRKVGVDGVIIPDLPFKDYIENYKEISEKYDIKTIMFITSETSAERIKLIDKHSSGFIYMVSSAGTTGAQSSFEESKVAYFNEIDSMQLQNPRLIGFGVSNKQTFDSACKNAKGAIIGSHFVKLLKSQPTIRESVSTLINDLKK